VDNYVPEWDGIFCSGFLPDIWRATVKLGLSSLELRTLHFDGCISSFCSCTKCLTSISIETEIVDLNSYTAPAQLSASKLISIVESFSC
jgi:hypothetical protein